MSSANMNRLKPIKDYLKSKFITVSDQWLTNQLNANSNISNDRIYQLWLNSDLRKISSNGIPVLPRDCNQIRVDSQKRKPEKTTLNGKYALQINSIEDISRPKILSAADALEEEPNSSEDNSDIESENNTKLFKRKKTKAKKDVTKRGPRMLSMQLTDGMTECKAIEYQAIGQLTEQTPIGTKLLICGPFDIYAAVVLLTARHVTVLGGTIPAESDGTGSGMPLRPLFPQTNQT